MTPWHVVLPYVLALATVALTIFVWPTHGKTDIKEGVYVGTGIVLLLMIIRQALAMREMFTLYNTNDALTHANHQLQTLATTDPLTGLPNRSYLHASLGQALAYAERSGTQVALLIVDLDRFKEVNDTLGHHFGDVLLQEVGQRIQSMLRPSDIIARLGGDEFAIMLPLTDDEGAVSVAEHLAATLHDPIVIEGHTIDVHASIGIALYPEHGENYSTLLRHADVAMYIAKRNATSHETYTEDQDDHTPYRLSLMNSLRHAINQGDLLLYYQPLVDLDNGDTLGVEALLRWKHPEHGIVPPNDFIPLAEQSGLIEPLTAWVLNEAIRQWDEWRDKGTMLTMSINLSMRSIHNENLPEIVTEVLHKYRMPATHLILEITESSIMADPQRAQRVLKRLAELGIRVAIDDFGTGYSSLSYLINLPVHEVKVDKSFVLGMDGDDKYGAIVRSIVSIAHALNMRVVAEGVETATAWDDLGRFGCDLAQGYYMSRPVPPSELEQWMARKITDQQQVS